jgi:eukaryotic-like serine/threonine-protein kinase
MNLNKTIPLLLCVSLSVGLCACAPLATTPSPMPSLEMSPSTDPTKTASPAPSEAPTSTPVPTAFPAVGDIIHFGKYEQDDNSANGKEPIAWRVLEVNDGRLLLLSEKNLDAKPYNTTSTSTTWETCSLRAWLNADFMNAAFDILEISAISQTALANPDNPKYGTEGGASTSDKVFLLSIEEANAYIPSDSVRIGLNTAYAIAQGAFDSAGSGVWWLRSPGLTVSSAAYVGSTGGVIVGGDDVLVAASVVRPAIWVDLAS